MIVTPDIAQENAPLLVHAIRAALFAGSEISRIYLQDFKVVFKSDESPLTLADELAHAAIVKTLSPLGIPILSEEGESISFPVRKNWPSLWIVDPLDGTKEFIKRNGEFTVNIALVKEGRPVLGVIYLPVKQIIYFADNQTGAFKAEKVTWESFLDSGKKSISLKDIRNHSQKLPLTSSKKYRVVASRSHNNSETLAFLENLQTTQSDMDIVTAGSSIKFCLLAEGSANIYPRFGPTMEWDTAAGQAILESAGGEVIDLASGKSISYNRSNLVNEHFIARNTKALINLYLP
jgi:3'(2'), 5'-bisphosphate nucleotidase